jgi:hypothetical protein
LHIVLEGIKVGGFTMKNSQLSLIEPEESYLEKHRFKGKVVFADAWNSKKDQLINARDASSGKLHSYYCYFCEARIYVKKGKGKRRPHFAHYNTDDSCLKKGESDLHALGKKIISESNYIKVPAYRLDASENNNQPNHELINYSSTVLEKLTDNIIPDIKLVTSEEEIFVEIVVTHGIDINKHNKINELGKRVLEIRLSEYKEPEICVSKLKEMILNDVMNKRWIHKRNIDLGNFIERELLSLGEISLQIFREKNLGLRSDEDFEIFKYKYVNKLEHISSAFDAFELRSEFRKVILLVQYENDLKSKEEMSNIVNCYFCFKGEIHLIDLSEVGNENIINLGISQLEKIREFIVSDLKNKACLFPEGENIHVLWHLFGEKPMILYSELNLCFLWIRKLELYTHKLMPSILYCKGRVLGKDDFDPNVAIEKQFGLFDGMISHAENPDWVFYKYPDFDNSIVDKITKFFSK